MLTRSLVLGIFAFLACRSSFGDVLVVADEFPVMQALASRLKSEENISSRVVSQKDMPASLSQFEAVVVYIHGALAASAEEAFIEYANGGGKLVLLHHSISSGKRKNAHWFSFLGVSLPEGPVGSGGYKWTEGVSWELVNLNPNHFIMTNRVSYPEQIAYVRTNAVSANGKLPGFGLKNSEVYVNHVHTEARTVLMGLKYKDEATGTVYVQDRAGWIKPSGKGWIVYLMPGHRQSDFDNVAYGRIVLNTVVWKP